MRSACRLSAALLAIALLSGCLAQQARHTHTMACVNAVLKTAAPLPEIVTLTRGDFARRFPGYDGYYVGREARVYLTATASGRLLAHELAHHARVQTGGWISEPEAERVARQCRGGGGWG